ncbi:MAG: hypothetical protein ACRD1J_08915, partial [Terriglobia bacterium]
MAVHISPEANWEAEKAGHTAAALNLKLKSAPPPLTGVTICTVDGPLGRNRLKPPDPAKLSVPGIEISASAEEHDDELQRGELEISFAPSALNVKTTVPLPKAVM